MSKYYYIKINEDEIANDYPLPAYYKSFDVDTDEYVIFDTHEFGINDIDELPRNLLSNWSLYNSYSRLISLELLLMKPCADVDVTMFGSGFMTEDDGSGFNLNSDPSGTSRGSGVNPVRGIPINLQAIRKRYRFGRPSKQYALCYKPILRAARLAMSMITTLKEQSHIAAFLC